MRKLKIAINKIGLNVEYLSFYSIFARAQHSRNEKEIVMNAEDIMTSKVITVTPETLVGKVAALLSEHRISAVPVVDKGQLVGIVSEADLLHRYEIGTDCALSGDPWWMRLFSADRSPAEYVKSHARQVRDIMTREVTTVAPDTALAEIASLLEKRRIKRVPVVEQGRLMGIVSRSDLVHALASMQGSGRNTGPIADEAIRSLLMAELRRQTWWRPELSNVTVQEGVVTYGGVIELENERIAARVAAETVQGVRDVVDNRLAYRDLPSMV
jgi:CBS domain-containing protein